MVKNSNARKISAEKTVTAIKVKEDIKNAQKNEVEQSNKQVEELNKEEILNSTGLSLNNPIITLVIHLLKIVLLLISNSGVFIIGEQSTGKSSLYTLFFNDLCTKVSGAITLAMLRGDARSSEKDSKCLLEQNTIVFEEMTNEPKVNGDIVGLIKDCIESKVFYKAGKLKTITNSTLIFIGNNYTSFKNFIEINKQSILKDLPKEFNDRALFDRIPFILPHYHSLLGKIEYIDKTKSIIPIIDLQEIFKNIREIPIEFIIEKYSYEFSDRELKIFNSFIFCLACLLYPGTSANNIQNWFIKGWIEFLKYFRGLLTEQYHNPFNKNSAKLILYLANYDFDKVEYVAYDKEDRLIIKLLNQSLFHKLALTGFGSENNRIEMEYFRTNPISSILSIKDLLNNDTLLIQESGEYLPDDRIYLNNIREINNSYNKTDDEYNKLVLEKLAKGETKYSFRGIPSYYYKGLLFKVQDIFGKNITEICFKDFTFDNSEIKILNFARYLKKL